MRELGIAGQVTLTQGHFERLECACKNLAIMSLPVPLSPWSKTGTVVFATRSIFSRAAAIIGDWPNTRSSGGRERMSTNSVARARGILDPIQSLSLRAFGQLYIQTHS